MKPASIAGRPDASNSSSDSCRREHQHLDHQRLARVPAPRLKRVELFPLPLSNVLLIVRPIPDEHFDEGAGERRRKGIGRPGERKRARFLRGCADVTPARKASAIDRRGVLLVDQQRAEFANGRDTVASHQECVEGEPLHLGDARPGNRSRVAELLPLPAVIGGEHVDAVGVQHLFTLPWLMANG